MVQACQTTLELSSGQIAENIAQQIEELSGLKAICGSDCISQLGQTESEEADCGSDPSESSSLNSHEPLEATLLIHVDLPCGHLKLTVDSNAAEDEDHESAPNEHILRLHELMSCSSHATASSDSEPGPSNSHYRRDGHQALPADTSAETLQILSHRTPGRNESERSISAASANGNDHQSAVLSTSQEEVLPMVTSLPPLNLRLVFPNSYPSAGPPAAAISAAWLAPEQAQHLQDHLYQIWDDQGSGLPICFTWLDWLQSCSLEHVNIQETLSLAPVAAANAALNAMQQGVQHHHQQAQPETAVASKSAPSVAPAASKQADLDNDAAVQLRPPRSASGRDRTRRPDTSQSNTTSNGHTPAAAAVEFKPLQNGQDHAAPDADGASFIGAAALPASHQAGPPLAGMLFAAADGLLGYLLRYDAMVEWDKWAQGVWPCGICLEEVAGSKCARLACKHAFCASCMQAHCRLHIKEGSLDHLRCPVQDCRQPLEPEAMADLLSEEEVMRWQTLEEQRTFERSGRAAYCPRCSSMCLEADDGSNCAQCPRCFFAFCTQCHDSWHPASQPCLSPEVALQALKLRMQGIQASASELKRRENEFLSLRAIQKNSKQCPTCKMAIQKASGCSHMVCGSCGTHFCWKCNKSIDGYEHFRNGGCMLFDAAEIREWEMQMARLTQAQHDREMAMMRNDFWRNNAPGQQRVRPQMCPRCGQPNYKHANNNSITCPSCTCRFCFLCREILQRGTRHFSGTGGCRQHS